MASTSYIQLIDKISAFCDAHYQIERFNAEFGEQRPNLATDSEKYPYVFLEPTSVDGGYDLRNFSVTITCYDIIQKDRDNLNTIVSDCEQILQDLFAYFNQGKDADVIALSNSKTPLNNYDLDYVAGWSMNIVFELEGWCTNAIPMTPITPGGSLCADADVDNSDSSYSVTVASGGSLSLPDSQLNFNGADQGDIISVKTVDIDLEDGAGNPVTPDAVSLVGNNLTIDVTVGASGSTVGSVNRSGQTTSRATGDDGDLENGNGTAFLTLTDNNVFGNLNRYTALDGTQTFGNIALDHTSDNGSTILGYYLTDRAGNASTALTTCNADSIDGYSSGWHLTSFHELVNLLQFEGTTLGYGMNYAPFNFATAGYFWTSTNNASGNYYTFNNNGAFTGVFQAPSLNYRYVSCRYFTYAELGV